MYGHTCHVGDKTCSKIKSFSPTALGYVRRILFLLVFLLQIIISIIDNLPYDGRKLTGNYDPLVTWGSSGI